MRRRQDSPWLVAERNRVRTEPTQGIAHRIADGESPLMAWRVESGFTIAKLDRLTGIAGQRLVDLEIGKEQPQPDELAAIAKALRVAIALLG